MNHLQLVQSCTLPSHVNTYFHPFLNYWLLLAYILDPLKGHESLRAVVRSKNGVNRVEIKKFLLPDTNALRIGSLNSIQVKNVFLCNFFTYVSVYELAPT